MMTTQRLPARIGQTMDLAKLRWLSDREDGSVELVGSVSDGWQTTDTVSLYERLDIDRTAMLGDFPCRLGAHWSHQPLGQSGWWLIVTVPESLLWPEHREQREAAAKQD